MSMTMIMSMIMNAKTVFAILIFLSGVCYMYINFRMFCKKRQIPPNAFGFITLGYVIIQFIITGTYHMFFR